MAQMITVVHTREAELFAVLSSIIAPPTPTAPPVGLRHTIAHNRAARLEHRRVMRSCQRVQQFAQLPETNQLDSGIMTHTSGPVEDLLRGRFWAGIGAAAARPKDPSE